MGNKNPGVMFYSEWLDGMKELTDEQIGKLTVAALRYGCNGDVPQFKESSMRMCWAFMVSRIDRDITNYRKKCNDNRLRSQYSAYRRKRIENGEAAMPFEEWLERMAEN